MAVTGVMGGEKKHPYGSREQGMGSGEVDDGGGRPVLGRGRPVCEDLFLIRSFRFGAQSMIDGEFGLKPPIEELTLVRVGRDRVR